MRKTVPITATLLLLALLALPIYATPTDLTSRVVDVVHSWIESLERFLSASETAAKDTAAENTAVDEAGVDIEPNG